MTGPEHYQKAEGHLRAATDPYTDTALEVGFARAHATLALAAATAAEPAQMSAWRKARTDWDAAVLPSTEWVCEGCDAAMVTAPGGDVPDPALCGPCRRSPVDPWEVTR